MRGRGNEIGEWESGWIPEISCWFILDVRGKYEQGVRDCSYTSIHIFSTLKILHNYVKFAFSREHDLILVNWNHKAMSTMPWNWNWNFKLFIYFDFSSKLFLWSVKIWHFFQNMYCTYFITIEIQEATLKNGQPGPNFEPNTG